MELNRVVITGLGSLTPIGNNTKEYWNNLLLGVSGAYPIRHFDASLFKTSFACEIKNFDILKWVELKEARKLDLFSQYVIAAADEAIIDSNIDLKAVNLEKVGVIVGTGMGGFTSLSHETERSILAGEVVPNYGPFLLTKVIGNIAPGHIAIRYGFKGLNYTTSSACASSANAIADAFNYIRLGKADIIVAGGTESPINKLTIAGFNGMGAISRRNDDPQTASRPFDKNRDGFVVGEGAGAIILESLEHAKARNATIYAELVGAGLSADAFHIASPHPIGEGAKLAMKNALEDANLSINSVDHINMHGTSTIQGDITETKAIMSLFGEHTYNIKLTAIKSMIGHLLGAAGVVESIATVLTIKNDIIPPTINHFEYDEAFDKNLNVVFNHSQNHQVNVAISNSFGFGGQNTSLVYKKYED
ncbi:MAG: beta-ketoacyl-ACP synthase II [Bacteroidales bacterium]|nr:beta-ketoacyl-ACP synthase II [Bacteroidales bacterium]MDD4209221.1 beta-ketoacyl-ACP synthase II [Bacteroidales bacterium]